MISSLINKVAPPGWAELRVEIVILDLDKNKGVSKRICFYRN